MGQFGINFINKIRITISPINIAPNNRENITKCCFKPLKAFFGAIF